MFSTPSKLTTDRNVSRRGVTSKSESRLNFNLNKSYVASQIFDESYSETMDIRSLNHGLPVIVSDALSSNKDFMGSARFADNDYVWLVVGRRLFVWKFSTHGKINTCHELALPVSDLEHKASLVCVTGLRGGHDSSVHSSPGCIAVSPEGMIRYWPRLYFEDDKVEATSILRGEECVQLEEVGNGIFLLATTTCTLLKVDIRNTNSLGIVCSVIGKPARIWSGIGRRVSSFFTLSSGQTAYNLKCVRMNQQSSSGCELYILTEQELQCKVYSDSLEETSSHEINVVRMVLDDVSRLIWQQDSYTLPNLKIYPVDMVLTEGNILCILLLVTNTDASIQSSKTVHYVIVQYNTDSEQFEAPVHLQWSETIRVKDAMPTPRLTLPHDASLYPVLSVCVWDNHSARVAEMATGSILSSMTFSAHGDGILCCSAPSFDRGQFIIFSKKHRILSIRAKRQMADTSNMSFMSHNNSAVSFASPVRPAPMKSFQAQDLSPGDSAIEHLSNATEYIRKSFSAFITGYKDRATKLMRAFEVRLMSKRSVLSGDVVEVSDWNLDEAVLALSNSICDETPSVDPRWGRPLDEDTCLVSSSSVIIQNHLEDKRKVHQNLFSFLNEYGLMSQLSRSVREERNYSTVSLLQLNAEKLEFAIGIRALQNSYGDIINPILTSVIQKRSKDSMAHELTTSDFFYREVTRIEELLPVILEDLILKEDLQDRHSVEQCVRLSYTLMSILRDVASCRRQFSKREASGVTNVTAFITNLVTVTQASLVAILERLMKIASHTKNDAGSNRMQLNTHLVDLVEYTLSGLNAQVEHAKENCSAETHTASLRSEFERIRGLLISALYNKLNEPESALLLSEKYQDFELLVRICEETESRERLQKYMRQFSNQGFQEFVFRWYLREGKRGQLMSAQLGHHQNLAQFLESEDSQYMAWLQHVNAGNFDKAADNLKDLAFSETKYLAKKKTLLSLAKLSNLAALESEMSREDEVIQLNAMLDVVQMQEGFPEDLLHNLGMDRENQPVFTPDNLIDLSIGEYNPHKGVADFRKALDLVQWLSEEKQTETRLHIWCRALLLDDWSQAQFKEGDPTSIFRDTVFYRILESAFIEGIDVREYVPSLEALLHANELAHLVDDNNFVFLLRAGYEQLERICS